jgi:hypothetical protein
MVPFSLPRISHSKIQLLGLASHLVVGFTLPQPVKAKSTDAKHTNQRLEFKKAFDRKHAITQAEAYIESLHYFAEHAESRGFNATAKAAGELARLVDQRIKSRLQNKECRKSIQLDMSLFISPAERKTLQKIEQALGADEVLVREFGYTQRFRGDLFEALQA